MVREQTLVIDEALTKGISPFDEDSRNLDYLSSVNGLTSNRNGLQPFREFGVENLIKISGQLLDETNGMNHFTTSPTSWTLGTGWDWDGNTSIRHSPGETNTGTLRENTLTLVSGSLYLVTVTITNLPADNLYRNEGSFLSSKQWVRVTLGSAVGPKIYENGTFSFFFPATTSGSTRLSLDSSPYGTVWVDQVQVYQLLNTSDIWHPSVVMNTSLGYLAFHNTGIQLLVYDGVRWTVRDYTLFDAFNPTSPGSITGSLNQYKLADFKNALFITRGTSFIMYLPSEREKFLVSTTTAPGAVLNYNNRLILGGLVGDPYRTVNARADSFFTEIAGWTLGTGWSISSGKLIGANPSGVASVPKPGPNTGSGYVYRLEFDIISNSVAQVLLDTNSTTDYNAMIEAGLMSTPKPGHYVVYANDDGSSNSFTFRTTGSGTVHIDNFKMYNVGFFGSSRWRSLFDLWKQHAPQDIMTSELQYFDWNWVMWSNLGGGDVYWPFTEEMAMLGFPDTARFDLLQSHFEDSIKAQQIGFLQMPFNGRVIGLQKVGEFILVFGEDGIAVMNPVEKAEGFGFTVRRIINAGINSRLAFAGTVDMCYFIDITGVLWMFQADGSLQNVGYRNILNNDGTWNLMYDQANESLYFNSNLVSVPNYILNRNGMTSMPYKFTSFFRYNNVFHTTPLYPGWQTTPSIVASLDPLSTAWEFVSNELDFGVRAIKTIHSIQIDSSFMRDMQVTIQYRYDTSSAWYSSVPVRVNDVGVAVVLVSGVDFRIKVTGYSTNRNNAVVRRLDVKWHLTDKRNVRGYIGQGA